LVRGIGVLLSKVGCVLDGMVEVGGGSGRKKGGLWMEGKEAYVDDVAAGTRLAGTQQQACDSASDGVLSAVRDRK
jgi:hypothetical protein